VSRKILSLLGSKVFIICVLAGIEKEGKGKTMRKIIKSDIEHGFIGVSI